MVLSGVDTSLSGKPTNLVNNKFIMWKIRLQFIRLCALGILLGLCSPSFSQAILTKIGSSFPMFNGADLSAWTQMGNAAWQVSNNQITVNQGSGMLVSKLAQPDYQIDFDYWVSENSQASIFIRCSNPNVINSETAFEIALSNQANQGAGSIVTINKVSPTRVTNQWNHIQVSAIGSKISVTLNGVSNQITDTRFGAGGQMAVNYQHGEMRLKNFNVTIPGRW